MHKDGMDYQTTTMREAFLNARFATDTCGPTFNRIRSAIRRGVGRTQRNRWWSVTRTR